MAKHAYNVIAATTEMPLWTTDGAAPDFEWGVYSDLGPFKPTRRSPVASPYARRTEHHAKHSPRKGWKRVASAWREIGEFFFGAFQPIRDAI